jgi:hypothetical protein
VGTDKTFKRRFCWPVQDRVRANPLSKAPRTSPVFTASDSLRLNLVVNPLPAASFVTSMPSSELTPNAAGRRGGSRDELCCCAGVVEYPGQASFHGEMIIPRPSNVLAMGVDSYPAGNTLAPDFFRFASGAPSQGSRAFELPNPDWRVLGEQDDAA